jgi:hypothetical protein
MDITSLLNTSTDERDELRWSSRGGFAFLFANGIVWLITAMLTFILPLKTAAFLILYQGAVALPLAFALERLLKFPILTKGNALVPLMVQTALVQIVALPAVILAYVFLPAYVPAVFAAIVGAHLLPYAWLHKSHLYIVLGLMISFVPYLLAMILRETSFHVIGFVVGGIAMVFAFLLKTSVEREQQFPASLAQAVAADSSSSSRKTPRSS